MAAFMDILFFQMDILFFRRQKVIACMKGELMGNGLREVKGCPSGRLSGSSYIRFTKDIEELKEDFKPLFWEIMIN